VGLVHHHITYGVRGSGPHTAVARAMAAWATRWWGWDVIHKWMLTGLYEWEARRRQPRRAAACPRGALCGRCWLGAAAAARVGRRRPSPPASPNRALPPHLRTHRRPRPPL